MFRIYYSQLLCIRILYMYMYMYMYAYVYVCIRIRICVQVFQKREKTIFQILDFYHKICFNNSYRF